jgi:hypothetical protein
MTGSYIHDGIQKKTELGDAKIWGNGLIALVIFDDEPSFSNDDLCVCICIHMGDNHYILYIHLYIHIFVMIKPTNLPNAPRGAVGRAVIFVAITVFHGCEPPTISGMHIHAITVVITTINTFDSLTKL